MATFAVRTIFKAQDKISKVFKTMGRNSSTFADRASKAFNKASRAGSKFGNIVKGIVGAQILTKGFAALSRGIGEVTRQFVSMDDAIFGAVARFEDVNILTAEGREKMQALRDTARQVGATTKFTATQAAQGLEFMAQAGFNAQQAMASLPSLVQLATVGNIDLARATDIATRSLGALGLKTKDTGQLIQNFTRFNDVMAKTTATSQATIEELFETTKFGGTKMTQAGQRIETFMAIVAALANKSISASMAGTITRRVLASLSDTASRSKLGALGVQVQDAEGNFRDLLDIMQDIETQIAKIPGSVAQAGIIGDIFGIRGQTGVEALISTRVKEIREYRTGLDNAKDAAKDMATVMEMSLGNRIKALISAALELGFKFIDAFEGKGRTGLDNFILTLRELDIQPVIEGFNKLLTLFGKLKKAIMPILSVILPPLVSLLGTLVDIIIILSPMLLGMAAAWGILNIVIALSTLKMTLFNLVTSANPISLIVLTIGAFVGALLWMSENMEKVEKVWNSVWKGIKKTFFTVLSVIVGGLGKLVRLILVVAKATGDVFGINTSGIDSMLDGLDRLESSLNSKSFFDDVEHSAFSKQELSQRINMSFSGQLNIAGAPAGSTFEQSGIGDEGAFDITGLGINP